MNLFEPRFPGKWSNPVLVQRPKMSRKVQLFANVNFLVPED